MKLIQGKDRLIRPALKIDDALFQHCAAGMEAVTEDRFKSFVEEMLFAHNEVSITITDMGVK